jgi:hypothetical protein
MKERERNYDGTGKRQKINTEERREGSKDTKGT